jgi:hypothetical protein
MSLVSKVDGFAGVDEKKKRFVRLSAYGGDIPKGTAVCFSTAAGVLTDDDGLGYGICIQAATTAAVATQQVIGIAAEAISDTEIGVVQVGGLCEFAITNSTAAAPGDLLMADASTAGQLEVYAFSAGNGMACAIHMADGTSDTAADSTVYLLNVANL